MPTAATLWVFSCLAHATDRKHAWRMLQRQESAQPSETGQVSAPSEKPRQKRRKRAQRGAQAIDLAKPIARDTSVKGVRLFTPPHEAIVRGWWLAGMSAKEIAAETNAKPAQIHALAKNRGWRIERKELCSNVDLITQDKLSGALKEHAKAIERTKANSIATAAQASALAKRALSQAKRNPLALEESLQASRIASANVSTFARLTPELSASASQAQPQAHLHLHLASQWQPRKVASASDAPASGDAIDVSVSAPE